MFKLFLVFLAWVLACSAVYYAFASHWPMVAFAFLTLGAALLVGVLHSNRTPNA